MGKKYTSGGGVALASAIQNTLGAGKHQAQLVAMCMDKEDVLLTFKTEHVTHIERIEKSKLLSMLTGELKLLNWYDVDVALGEGVCAVAHGSGYNLIEYPNKTELLKNPVELSKLLEIIKTRKLMLSRLRIEGIKCRTSL